MFFTDPWYSWFFLAGNYCVLGGQHVSSALVHVLRDVVRTSKGLPDWLRHVMVEVIVTRCGLQT